MGLGWGLLVLAVLAWMLRAYVTSKRAHCTSNKSLAGKTVLVTGSAQGIGKEAAREFARRGARVLMACRALNNANMARDEIRKSTGNMDVEVRRVDISSLRSVREFCARINQEEERLDILVHNAGTAEVFRRLKSPEGLELTMATNQYGPFLMTHLLIDLLKKSSPCRVVIVASSWYQLAYHSLENAGNHVTGLPWFLYYLSKYANIQFSLELARRLQGTGVSVNCLNPGNSDTGIWKNVPFPFNLLLAPIKRLYFQDTVEGAQTILHVALAEQLEHVSGKYFSECQEATLRSDVTDPESCRKFWQSCEKLCLSADDPRL